jgi:uncharacterized phage protein gp47/JayE
MTGITAERPGNTLLVADPTSDAAVNTLVDTLTFAGDLLSQIVTAIGNVKTFEGTSRSEALEADLYGLVEELADLGVAVVS